MKNITIIPCLAFALACVLGVSQGRADYTDDLLAGWTFNDGTLTSDLGTRSGASAITFSQTGTGSNQTTTFNDDGTVSLGTGRMLYTTAINSTDYPVLLSGVTLWVQVRFDGSLANSGIFGLLNSASAKSGADGVNNYSAAFQVSNVANRTGAFSGHTTDGSGFGPGSGNPTIPSPSGFVDIAIRVSDLGTNSSLASVTVDGVTKTATWAGSTEDLQSIAALALGRIKTDAGMALTFDEVRVYSAYLTDDQLASISAVAIPEPAMTALGIGGAVLLAGFFLRRRRS